MKKQGVEPGKNASIVPKGGTDRNMEQDARENKAGNGEKGAFWRTLGATLALAGALAGGAEVAARSGFVRRALPAPSIGSGHPRLDIKLELLDRFVREEGRLDCLFLGASDVNLSIDPEEFARAYAVAGGCRPVTFNFGLDGFVPPATAVLAGILVEKYRPHWLVWGVTPASFSGDVRKRNDQIVRSHPWFRHRTGSRNLEGWLIENSAAYRYFLRFRIWLERPNYSRTLSLREAQISRAGVADWKKARVIDEAAGGGFEKAARQRRFPEAVTLDLESLAVLDAIKGMAERTQVLVLEIPVLPRFYRLFGNGAFDQRKALRSIRSRAERCGALFVSPPPGLVPEQGFANSNHMNGQGAEVFSRWLALQLKREVDAGRLHPPPGSGDGGS